MTESSVQVAAPTADATACGYHSLASTYPAAVTETSAETPVAHTASRLLESRHGRELQRYDGATRLLACAVVMRTLETTHEDQVLVISSSKHTHEWILPKGGWESDETLVECALREVEEEAGIDGRIVGELGTVDFSSRQGKKCRFYGFRVSARQEFSKWAESDRQRKWVSVDEGKRLLSHRPELLVMLARAEMVAGPY
uniref:Nudix hydrolase domain-containing protein n=1 Tax=Globisporangium ultimum (strain ATCC 200006 / CBS 805.95 / DAOM BR144) TaxID=431595 RepID=K3WXL1_GLOUD